MRRPDKPARGLDADDENGMELIEIYDAEGAEINGRMGTDMGPAILEQDEPTPTLHGWSTTLQAYVVSRSCACPACIAIEPDRCRHDGCHREVETSCPHCWNLLCDHHSNLHLTALHRFGPSFCHDHGAPEICQCATCSPLQVEDECCSEIGQSSRPRSRMRNRRAPCVPSRRQTSGTDEDMCCE